MLFEHRLKSKGKGMSAKREAYFNSRRKAFKNCKLSAKQFKLYKKKFFLTC